jgi:ABC-type polar amino acid transport system ATPase subunit
VTTLETDSAPRVVIVGGGFGGLAAAQALRKADAHVVLIDRQNHHVFQPLLYQVVTSVLSPAQIASPIRGVLKAMPLSSSSAPASARPWWFVTHELASIFAIADRAVFLDAETRTMIAVGAPKKLRAESPEATVRAFLTRGGPYAGASTR